MDLQYFKLNAEDAHYFPFDADHKWVMLAKARASYGDGYGTNGDYEHVLPFFENYYAGGFDTLRGFKSNTVGPKALYYYNLSGNDVIQGTDSSVGGNALAVASLEMIVPTPFASETYQPQLRTSFFIDAGSVWDTHFDYSQYQNRCFSGCNYLMDYSDPSNIRMSTGLSLQWLSPMGPLVFVLARPIKKYEGDDTQVFSFNIGRTF